MTRHFSRANGTTGHPGVPAATSQELSLSPIVAGALAEVGAEGDTAEVAMRLAQRVDAEGATPSAVRELRYALLALGVTAIEPYVALMRATKAAIDRSDDSLPTLAAQLREQEQTCQKLAGEPRNSAAARAAETAVTAIEQLWTDRFAEYLAGTDASWDHHHAESKRLHHEFDEAGGKEVFPTLAERLLDAFDNYWQGRRRHRHNTYRNLH
jgi:hypothetical protein